MTAQIGEDLIFKGEKMWMASLPLSYYLANREDIRFYPRSSACWRGYVGQWEIKEDKLYLIGLEAMLQRYEKVGMDYLFPGQKEVFADWFSGNIRIPQGEMLEYVHLGYESLYERDLMLEFKNGILINEYIVENERVLQERLKEQESINQEFEAKAIRDKKKEKILAPIVIILLMMVLAGMSIGIYKLISTGTILSYCTSLAVIIPSALLFKEIITYFQNNSNRRKQDQAIRNSAMNVLVLIFIGISIAVYFLIKWETILGYSIAFLLVGLALYLIFLAIKNRLKNK